MVGETWSLNGIASPGCFQPVFGGDNDAFIAKFDSSGQRLWGTYYGGTSWDWGYGCAIGWNGEIFLAGNTESTNNISTPNSFQPALAGTDNGFLVKFNVAGQRLWGPTTEVVVVMDSITAVMLRMIRSTRRETHHR